MATAIAVKKQIVESRFFNVVVLTAAASMGMISVWLCMVLLLQPSNSAPQARAYDDSHCRLCGIAPGRRYNLERAAPPAGFALRGRARLKPNLMVSADCEPTSASRIRRSSESSTGDFPRSQLS